MSADAASASQFDTMTKRLQDAVAGLVTASWTFQGEPLHYDEATDSFTLDLSRDPGDQLTVTGPDNASFSLSGPEAVFVQGTESLGVGELQRTLTGTTPDGRTVRVRVNQPDGTEVTAQVDNVPDLTAFEQDGDGAWTAHGTAANQLGTPAADGGMSDVAAWVTRPAVLSDGTRLDGQPGPVTVAKGEHGKTTWTRDITYTGRDARNTPVRIILTASRTYDPTVNLTVTSTDAEGKTDTVWSTGLTDGARLQAEYTLDALGNTRIGERYQLAVTGLDATANTIRDVKVRNGLGANGARTFIVTYTLDRLNGTRLTPDTRSITVRLPFQEAIWDPNESFNRFNNSRLRRNVAGANGSRAPLPLRHPHRPIQISAQSANSIPSTSACRSRCAGLVQSATP